jgi:hypothetical protein
VPLSPPQLATLRALLDRLIPADEFPGALAAGTEHYLLRQLAGDCAAEAATLALGLTQLDREAVTYRPGAETFPALPPADQEALLTRLETGHAATTWPAGLSCVAWFNRFVDLAHEGFYADPANGGNRDAASWQMLGYAPRTELPDSSTLAANATPPSTS